MIDIHQPGVLHNLMNQVNMAERNMLIQKRQQTMLMYSTLTMEEKLQYAERVHRMTSIGGFSRAEAEYTTLESLINMRNHKAAQAAEGKQVAPGIQQAFEEKILEVVPEKDRIEILHEEAKNQESHT